MSDLLPPDSARDAASPASRQTQDSSLHQHFFDNAFDGVYIVDRDRRITYWNHGAENLTGFTSHEVTGKPCFHNILMHVDGEGCALCDSACPLSATLNDGESRELQIYLRHKQGHRIPVRARVAPVKDVSGAVVGAVHIFTETRAFTETRPGSPSVQSPGEPPESTLGPLTSGPGGAAHLDPLTGLSNARHLELKIRQALEEDREFGKQSGLLIIDIDHLTEVNNQFGPSAGDAVLQAVAATLLHTLRPGDCAGRWGEEEFLLVAMDVDLPELEMLGERLRKLIASSPVPVPNESLRNPSHQDQLVPITVSVGGALMSPRLPVTLAVEQADAFMYLSKVLGRNRTTVG